jgi:Lrp/AsnC family transcriptional regulator, leucine-responsive regulatory protein
MPHFVLSPADLRILAVLQHEGRISNVDLAERVSMSPSPCLRRTRELERAGVIRRYAALVNRKAVGLGVEAFAQVSIDQGRDAGADAFRAAILARREIIACYVMTGEMDFLLHVVVPDLDSYADFAIKVLLKLPGVKNVRTSFAIDMLKEATALPLPGDPVAGPTLAGRQRGPVKTGARKRGIAAKR